MLLHCSQGVSRSASLAIAYLMWKQSTPFDNTLAAVKAIRGVANPNIGFTCQVCWPSMDLSAQASWHCFKTCMQHAWLLSRHVPYLSEATAHAAACVCPWDLTCRRAGLALQGRIW